MRFHDHMPQIIHFFIIFFTPLIALASSTLSSPPPQYNFTVAKPGCEDRCGDVSIPFPFGMTSPECYLNDRFLITCNKSSNPHKPLLTTSEIEITDISLNGQLRLLHFISHDCYTLNSRTSSHNSWMSFARFTVNSTANKFTVMGCDTYGYFLGRRHKSRYRTQTGCMAMCGAAGDLAQNTCAGTGCCQIPIPDDVWRMNLTLGSFSNYSTVSGLSNCSYAFVVEESAYTFSPDNLTNSMDINTKMPMVVDWAIGINGTTCEAAQMNTSSYACKGANATCLDNQTSYGYRCSCNDGYQGNPYLEHGCQDINECLNKSVNGCQEKCINTPGSFYCDCPKGYSGDGKTDGKGCIRGESLAYKLAAGISSGVILLLLASCWLYFGLQQRRLVKLRQKIFIQNGGKLLQERLHRISSKTMIFTESDLQNATDNFSSSKIIGQGGNGTVYKGLLTDKRIVAIKKSKELNRNQIDQFINEVIVLSQINHNNVVILIGCCLETPVPLLVYEFISNGTLFEHVHDKKKACELSWDMRLKIATDTAGVLWYLHSSASTPIIHRDVKSANILLDNNFRAKVADFGASKLVPLDQMQLSTMVQGTFGYLDPEYMQTNQLTEKSDVYSFGIVLVELITGMKALSYDRPEEERNLANFFLSIMKQNRLFRVLANNDFAREENKEQVMKVAELARICLNVKGDDRPSMKEVAMELEGLFRVRVREKQYSWVEFRGEDMDQSLLGNVEFSSFTNSASNSTSVGFDSLKDQIIQAGGSTATGR